MYIELLWIIPLIAFTFLIFLIVSFSQKKEPNDLSQEVVRFNNGYHGNPGKQRESKNRLKELKSTISEVTESISQQQQAINNFQIGKTESDLQIQDLKEKLRELYREYDIVLSENYTLKAKVNNLTKQKYNTSPKGNEIISSQIFPEIPEIVNAKLFDDKRLVDLMSLEDTAEIDMTKA